VDRGRRRSENRRGNHRHRPPSSPGVMCSRSCPVGPGSARQGR
jgi:hypothetical protein